MFEEGGARRVLRAAVSGAGAGGNSPETRHAAPTLDRERKPAPALSRDPQSQSLLFIPNWAWCFLASPFPPILLSPPNLTSPFKINTPARSNPAHARTTASPGGDAGIHRLMTE